jgi:hypothetical protein
MQLWVAACAVKLSGNNLHVTIAGREQGLSRKVYRLKAKYDLVQTAASVVEPSPQQIPYMLQGLR